MVGYKHPVLRTPLHWRGISHVDGCGVVVVLSKALPQRALSFAQRARSLGVVVVFFCKPTPSPSKEGNFACGWVWCVVVGCGRLWFVVVGVGCVFFLVHADRKA